MSDNGDDEYDIKLDTNDPRSSLQERKDSEKRTASPSVKSDLPRPRYQIGENLLCYDGPDLYPAKCMKLEHDGKMYSYLIHYNGWSKTYDEWMNDDDPRLATVPKTNCFTSTRSKTPSPIKIEHEPKRIVPSPLVLNNTAVKGKNDKNTSKRPDKTKIAKPDRRKVKNRIGPKPRRPDGATDYQKRFILRIIIPDTIKEVLQDDHEFITKQQKIIPLPVETTVHDILADFEASSNVPVEVLDFEHYFNKVLGSKLLYKFERPMYADYLRKYRDETTDAQQYPSAAPKPAYIYGFHHLVRYTYHLDQVLYDVETNFSECLKSVKTLQQLVDYLATRVPELHRTIFYHETAPEYHRRAQS